MKKQRSFAAVSLAIWLVCGSALALYDYNVGLASLELAVGTLTALSATTSSEGILTWPTSRSTCCRKGKDTPRAMTSPSG